MRNKNQSGFTLIELLVVIAIIGLLASIVLLALNGARAKSRDAKRIADVRQIASALELFYNDFNSYPTTPITTQANATAAYITPNYIGIWPSSPTPADGSCNNSATYPGNTYSYNPGATTYTLTFCLGGVTGGYGPGAHTLSQAGIQ